jgi:uncharacterized protein YcfJ
MAKRLVTILIAVFLVFAFSLGGGCANNAQTGAAIGAAGGALIGAVAGGAEGFIIGTAIGAGAGYMVGNEADKPY